MATSPTRGSGKTIKVRQGGYTRTYRNGRLVSETNPQGKKVVRIATSKRRADEGGGTDITKVEELATKQRLQVEKYQAKLRKLRQLKKEKALQLEKEKLQAQKEKGRFQTESIKAEVIKTIEARRIGALAAAEARREQEQATRQTFSPGATMQKGEPGFKETLRLWEQEGDPLFGSKSVGAGLVFAADFFEGVGRGGKYVIDLPKKVVTGEYSRDVGKVKDIVSDPFPIGAAYGQELLSRPERSAFELGSFALIMAAPGGFKGTRTAESIADTAAVTRTTGRSALQQAEGKTSIVLETFTKEVKTAKAPKGVRMRLLAFEGEGLAVQEGAVAEIGATGRFRIGRGSAIIDDLKITPKSITLVETSPKIKPIIPGKTVATQEFKVGSFSRLDIRPAELVEIGEKGVKRFPYVRAKDVKVKESVRTLKQDVEIKLYDTQELPGIKTDAFILGELTKPKPLLKVAKTSKPPIDRLILVDKKGGFLDIRRGTGRRTPFKHSDLTLDYRLQELSSADVGTRGVQRVNIGFGSGKTALGRLNEQKGFPGGSVYGQAYKGVLVPFDDSLILSEVSTAKGVLVGVEAPLKPSFSSLALSPGTINIPNTGLKGRLTPVLRAQDKKKQDISTKLKLQSKLNLKLTSREKVLTGENVKVGKVTGKIIISPPKIIVEQKPIIGLSTVQIPKSILSPPKTVTTTTPKTRTKRKPRMFPPLLPSFNFPQPADTRLSTSFDVQVRRRGVFRTIASGLTKGEALQVGKMRVESTAAATFKLEKSGTTTRKDKGAPFLGDFEKKGNLTFIQKREKRISSSGELREITFKGLSALKAKRGFRL